MSSSDESESFVVVEFLEDHEFKSVDLILDTWIVRHKQKLMCYYPHKKDFQKVRAWVKQKKSYSVNWPTYPIKILSKTDSFDQGERRLQKSYTTLNIESSDVDKKSKDTSRSRLDANAVQLSLADISPLKTPSISSSPRRLCKNLENTSSYSKVCQQAIGSSDDSQFERHQSDDSNYIITELKKYIYSEFEGMKKSMLYEIKKQFNHMIETFQVETSKKTIEDSPWKVLDLRFPREDQEQFAELEMALLEKPIKQDALKEIFHLLTVGCNDFKRDIQTIIGKLISKNVQLNYSGAGRKVNGVGKKSFQDTESYKCMNDFLQSKYKNSTVKLTILTATSHYLSGAGDREGGKKKRKLNHDDTDF